VVRRDQDLTLRRDFAQTTTGGLVTAVSSWFRGSSLHTIEYVECSSGGLISVPSPRRPDLAWQTSITSQRVFDIIHPDRRNLTAIRGYKRLGGLPDDPATDPQDRSWYGPHDRLFKQEESEELKFEPGPDHGAFSAMARERGFLRLWVFR
jgi:alpha-1,3-mannosyltransferase